jgi:hypothetical protein
VNAIPITHIRSMDGRETVGMMLDLCRDFRGTRAAALDATPDVNERRAELAEHCGHRVELRHQDGTVAARGELFAVTVVSAHMVHLEAGEARVPLGDVAQVVRLQPRKDTGVYPVEQAGGAK